MTAEDLTQFLAEVEPRALLRTAAGLDVRVGRHRPPRGGLYIESELRAILDDASPSGSRRAYAIHCRYETLHPFTDGNGRSGRALWLWMMGGLDGAPLGFLHHWYYQSLDAAHRTPPDGRRTPWPSRATTAPCCGSPPPVAARHPRATPERPRPAPARRRLAR